MFELKRLDLNLLVILDALHEYRSLTRVAERLKLSQPTVSSGLRKLRVALNDELFIRMDGEMRPTERALQLRDPVKKILETIEAEVLAPIGFDPRTYTGTFTLSTSDVGEIVILPNIIRRLNAHSPGSAIRNVVREPHALADEMAEGNIDLAFGYFPDLHSAALMQRAIFEVEYACIVRSGHPHIKKALSLRQYRDTDHLMMVSEIRRQENLDRALRDHGVTRNIKLTISHYMNAAPTIASSDLIATVPRPIAEHFARLYPISIFATPFPVPKLEIRLFWHRRFQNSPKVSWLRTQITGANWKMV